MYISFTGVHDGHITILQEGLWEAEREIEGKGEGGVGKEKILAASCDSARKEQGMDEYSTVYHIYLL